MEDSSCKDNGNVKSKSLELPWQMMIVMLLCVIMVIVLGLGNTFIVNNILSTTVMEVLLS